MLAGNVSRVLRQPVGTKYLSTNWPNESPFGVSTTKALRKRRQATEVAKAVRGGAGRNYCRHELLNVSFLSR